jgi:hypothetical protein
MFYDRNSAYKQIDNLYETLSIHFGTGNLIEDIVYINESSGVTTTYSGNQYADNTNPNIDSKAWMIADFFASLFSIDDYSSLVLSYQLSGMTGQKLNRPTIYWHDNEYVISPNKSSYYTPFYQNRQVVMGGVLLRNKYFIQIYLLSLKHQTQYSLRHAVLVRNLDCKLAKLKLKQCPTRQMVRFLS